MKPQINNEEEERPEVKKIKAYWAAQKRKGLGRKKNIESPDKMWELACGYFESVDCHPWLETQYRGREVTEVKIEKAVAYSWVGFQSYVYSQGINANIDDYRRNKTGAYAEYSTVLQKIEKIIKNRIIEGVSMGYFSDIILKYHEMNGSQKDEIKNRQVFIINGQEIVVG